LKNRTYVSVRRIPRFTLLDGSLLLLATAMVVLAPHRALAQGNTTTTRPFSDWLSTQGTFCAAPFGVGGGCLFVPPVPNYVAWTSGLGGSSSQNTQNRFTLIDYAGLANAWIESQSAGAVSLGTQVSGTVTERALDDGSAEVTVLVHTKNALAWVISGDGKGNYDTARGPLLFGHRAQDVLAGGDAVLGNCNLEVVFINTAPGAPLPDLVQLTVAAAPGTRFTFEAFQANATGTLRANFGVSDGTPGREQVTQTGVLSSQGSGGPRHDFFPAEHIDLFVIGK
jgi:hypothetical protein